MAKKHPGSVANSFADSLISDVIEILAAWNRLRSPARGRNLIRTVFSAIEGFSWLYRNHVIEVARDIDILTSEEEAALAEQAYSVTDNGKISKQSRFIPLTAMLRLTTRIAMRLDSALVVRFDGLGWQQFQDAAKIRNRITHPKREVDLNVSEQDIATCLAAFEWLMTTAVNGMDAAQTALKLHSQELQRLVEALKSGDKGTLAEYHAAAAALDT